MSHRRSPARWLGPLALLAALAAVFAIVSATTGGGGSSEPARQAEERPKDDDTKTSTDRQTTSTGETETTTTPKSERKTYTVRPGDTLAGIAEETGVSIQEIQELNPGVDSNSLAIGQELRLAR
jgi:LysM repeat protein